jgi:PiT family inorganic phosphate transporter
MGALILLAGFFVAYVNGANDNFKGVATLFGSGTTDYKRALYWATATTLLGSVAALFISQGLVAAFSGKGLVPAALVQMPSFSFSVAAGAAMTVFIATITGLPISTTHALVGGLVGAGVASGQSVQFQKLANTYVLPLLLSPIVSILLTVAVYPAFRKVRKMCGINGATCLCVDGKDEIVAITPSGAAVLQSTGLTLTMDQREVCQTKYLGTIAGVEAQEVLSVSHYLTAGTVSFARGLNDTPKIVAILLAAQFLGIKHAILGVGIVIALGGLIGAQKVARTMSQRITSMNHGQGFTANLIAAVLVIMASIYSLPVSTTHVTCGSIFGVGLMNGKANWQVIRNILLSWVATLPLAGLLSAAAFLILRRYV